MSDQGHGTETWRAVVGYEGHYEVSDHGRVRGVGRKARTRAGYRTVPARLLTIYSWGTPPYPMVTLSRNDRPQQHAVHTLVLTAFKGPRPRGKLGLHGDDDVENNHLPNLRWGTGVENAEDKRRNGIRVNRYDGRTACDRGHRLGEPNVTGDGRREGHLGCLACQRGGNKVRKAAARGIVLDLQQETDAAYRKITGEAA